MRKLRVGVIGLGGIATRVHIPVLTAREDTEVIAGAEVNEMQRARSQERFNIRETFSNYESMLKRSQLDAVYICLPNHLHLDAVAAALDNNLHVYCEKPVGLSLERLLPLVSLAKSKNLILMPGFNRRFTPNYLRAKQLIQSKLIGKVIQVQATSCTPGPYAGWDPKSEWYYNKDNYGVLYDQGSHVFDLLNFLTGQTWKTILASSVSSLDALDIPDNIVIIAKNNHTICSVNIGWNAGRYIDCFAVHGTAGSIIVSPDSFEHITPNSAGIDKIRNLLENTKTILMTKVRQLRGSEPSDLDYVAITDHFVKSVLKCDQPALSGECGLKLHQVLDAVKESLNTGKVAIVNKLPIC